MKKRNKKTENAQEQNPVLDLALEGTYGATPFVRSTLTTSECMLMVVISLLPCAGFAIYSYGLQAAILIGVSIGSCVAFELVAGLIFQRRLTIRDWSAVVTGLIGALLLPVNVPLIYPVIAAGVSIVGAKMLFGGIGRNILNPAAVGHLVLTILYYPVMTNYGSYMYGQETPLRLLATGMQPDLKQMLFGTVPGMMGTTCVIAIMAGAIFLLALGLIGAIMPFCAILGFTVCYVLFGINGLSYYYVAANLAGGGLLFVFFFMTADYSTRPLTRKGRIIYGTLVGILTFVYRYFGFIEEGAIYALLTANVFSRLIDAKTMPKPFGTRQVQKTIRLKSTGKNQRGLSAEQEEEVDRSQSEADFEEFMRSVMPADAAKGSETAGTINKTAVETFNNRKQVMPRVKRQSAAAQTGQPEPFMQNVPVNNTMQQNRSSREPQTFNTAPPAGWNPQMAPVEPIDMAQNLPQPETRYTSEYAQYIARQEQKRQLEEQRRRYEQERLRAALEEEESLKAAAETEEESLKAAAEMGEESLKAAAETEESLKAAAETEEESLNTDAEAEAENPEIIIETAEAIIETEINQEPQQ